MKINALSPAARAEAHYQRLERLLSKTHHHGAWVSAFAFLPVRINADTVIWLENYEYRLADMQRIEILPGPNAGLFAAPIRKVVPVYEYRLTQQVRAS